GPAAGPRADVGDLLDLRCTALARRFALSGREDATEVLARMRAAGWYDRELSPADVARAQLAWAEFAGELPGYRPGGYDGPAVLCVDGLDATAVAESWRAAIPDARIHLSGYGVESPAAVLADARLDALLRQRLNP
ncbi:hypothetical protein ACFQ0D_32865, partial [Micromonospora zhanjiangensis]